MSEEEQVILIGHNDCYHKPSYSHVGSAEILHTVCGLNSLNHDMALYPRGKLFLAALGVRSCKRCFNERHCELCGEKMPGLRWIAANDTVYHACEICVSDFE